MKLKSLELYELIKFFFISQYQGDYSKFLLLFFSVIPRHLISQQSLSLPFPRWFIFPDSECYYKGGRFLGEEVEIC